MCTTITMMFCIGRTCSIIKRGVQGEQEPVQQRCVCINELFIRFLGTLRNVIQAEMGQCLRDD